MELDLFFLLSKLSCIDKLLVRKISMQLDRCFINIKPGHFIADGAIYLLIHESQNAAELRNFDSYDNCPVV